MQHQFIEYEGAFIDELKRLSKKKKPHKKTPQQISLKSRLHHFIESGAGFSEIDLERYLGENELLRINYLERGWHASRAVCRLVIPDPVTGQPYHGTGFLISPQLLITNNHVIETEAQASAAVAEFDFQCDSAGNPLEPVRFSLNPQKGFFTSPKNELDVSIIAIDQQSEKGDRDISEFGFLRLIPDTNKIQTTEFVSIIQHPEGKEKYISIRENKVIKIGDEQMADKNNFIWYSSDTAKGSSGAPAMNDSWQVVGVHHRAVPEYKKENGDIFYKKKDGTWINKRDLMTVSENEIVFVANEGVRTSKIVAALIDALKSDQIGEPDYFKELVLDITKSHPFQGFVVNSSVGIPLRPDASPLNERTQRSLTHQKDYYTSRKGYDEDFLGKKVPLPTLSEKALSFGQVAINQVSNDEYLDYENFTVVFNADRKLAFYTVVNIDGSQWRDLKRGGRDKWYFDSRIPLDIQLGNDFYREKQNYFDRGHLVRRLDPVWGSKESAVLANHDTFHWTNCSPQYFKFNQSQEIWQGLENYILYNTDKDDLKATVFTGPVFNEEDEVHRGIKVPQHYWKVVVVVDAEGKLYSSAYLVSQEKWAKDIPFEALPTGEFKNFQTSIAHIEDLTGLLFNETVRKSDVFESAEKTLPIRSLADIQHPRR